MLEDEKTVAINEIILFCRHAETRYKEASSLFEASRPGEMAGLFSEARKQMADRLEHAVKAMGGLPFDANAEKPSLEKFWAKIKIMAGNDKKRLFLDEGISLETEILDQCNYALEKYPDSDVTRILSELKQQSAAFRQWFEKEKAGP